MKASNTQLRLMQIMDERNLKQVDIINLAEPYCKKYNVKLNKSDISQYLSGKTTPNQDKLVVLSMALNVSETWLMGYDVPRERASHNISIEEVIPIPVYGKISAGQPLEMVENIIDYTYITAEEAKKGSFFALEVNGDSMDKIIPNGSRVLVRKQEELENGEIGVIVINGYDATIKRYERDNENVYLYPESYNPEHRVQRYSLKETPVSILGKVESYNKKL